MEKGCASAYPGQKYIKTSFDKYMSVMDRTPPWPDSLVTRVLQNKISD